MGTTASPIRVPDRVNVGILGLGAVAQAVHLPLLERLQDLFVIWAIAYPSPGLVDSIGNRQRVPRTRRSTTFNGLLVVDEHDSPYLLNAPTELRITEPRSGGRRDTRYTSVVEAFEEELLVFHAYSTDGQQPRAGLDEGRADTFTAQRIVARRAAQLGRSIRGEAAG